MSITSDDLPTFGSLFAGIGGIDLGLERAGWRGRWQVEYEPFCQRVLAKHWPDVTRYGDIHDVDWSGVEPVDLIAGGFPCQPVSVAGKRLAQDDDRWLWPEFARAIRGIRPRYVLVENVPGLLVRGMGDVQRDLAELGYRREWDVLAAADVGAPHLRKRVWIVARAEQSGALADTSSRRRSDDRLRAGRDESGSSRTAVADAPRIRRRASGRESEPVRTGRDARLVPVERGPDTGAVPYTDRCDAQGLEPERDDATDRRVPPERPARLFGGARPDRGWPPEPDVGRVAHGVPARVDRLRALGNAVVPQVVEFIGRRILEAEGLR